ncbi:MAG: Hpt domain-containing protein, partial [Phycisphaerae bacterium]
MPWKEPVLNAIKGLRGWMQVADAGDKDVIVGIGTSLESGFSKVPDGETLQQVAHQMLLRLQAIYQDQVDNPAEAMQQLAKAVEIAQSYLEEKVPEEKLSEAMSLVRGEADAATPTETDQLAGTDDAKGNASTTPDGEQPAPASAGALSATQLEQLAGKLVALDAEDTDQLSEVHQTLVSLAAVEGVALEVTEHVGIAAAQLDLVLQGLAPDAGEALSLAATEIQAAAEATPIEEDPAEPEPTAESVEPEPQAEEPAQTPQAIEMGQEPEPAETGQQPSAPPEPEEQPEPQPAKSAAPAVQQGPDVDDAPRFDKAAILSPDTDLDLLKDFITECMDHINMAEAALLELESNPDDMEQVNVVFRAFHTIKGTSGFFGLDRNQ